MKDATSAYLQGSAVGAIIGIVAGIAIGLHIERGHTPDAAPTADTTRITITDTIRVVQPIPRDTLIVRYDTARLPTPDGQDTATVAIPISRVEYADTLYRAVIEGYQPRLLSLDITAPTERITITHTIPAKQRRWGLSVGAGLTATTRGDIAPGIFLGASYTFLAF